MKAFTVCLMLLVMALMAPNATADSFFQANGLDNAVCHSSINAGGEKDYQLTNEQTVEIACKDTAEFSAGNLPNPLVIAGSLFVMAFVGILLLI